MIRLLLVEDHEIVRAGIRALLERQEDLVVIADVGDGLSAVKKVQEHGPDIVIMDVALPEMNGIEATREIKQEHPHIQVIALSMHRDERFVLEMLKAGASGYLLKSNAPEELVQAVRAARRGEVYLSPAIAGRVVDRLDARGESSAYAVLSDRQRQVLKMVAEGRTAKEIADTLNVSRKTVDSHRQHIMDKLGLDSVAALTKYAIQQGLTSLED